MPLPSSGKISLGDIRTELNKTGSISLGSTDVRNLAGKTSGIIKMSDLRGKSYGVINFETEIIVGNDPDGNGGYYFQSWGARCDSKTDYVGGKIINPRINNKYYLAMVSFWYNNSYLIKLFVSDDPNLERADWAFWTPATDLKEYKSFKYIIDGTGEIQLWLQDKFYNTTQNREIFNYLKSKYKQKIKFRIEAIP